MWVLRGWQRGHVVAPESLRSFSWEETAGMRRENNGHEMDGIRAMGSGSCVGRISSMEHHRCPGGSDRLRDVLCFSCILRHLHGASRILLP